MNGYGFSQEGVDQKPNGKKDAEGFGAGFGADFTTDIFRGFPVHGNTQAKVLPKRWDSLFFLPQSAEKSPSLALAALWLLVPVKIGKPKFLE